VMLVAQTVLEMVEEVGYDECIRACSL